MKIQSKPIERRFIYNGQTFADPLPGGSVVEVQQILAKVESGIGTAVPLGPSEENGVQIYTFTQSVGTKG